MMRGILIGMGAAALVSGGLAAIGFTLAPYLIPEPPNRYRTSVFEFNLPKGWKCTLEESEHVCLPVDERPARSIIIFTMKYRKPGDDTLYAYEAHLSRIRIQKNSNGEEVESTIDYVRRSSYGGRSWVDARHLGSELPGYYTRYLATVTSHVGILATFSASEEFFKEFTPVFEKSVASLKVYQPD